MICTYFKRFIPTCFFFYILESSKIYCVEFPGGPVVKSPPCHAGDAGSVPGHGTEIPHTVE